MCLTLNQYWQQHGQAILDFGLVPCPQSSGIGSNTYRTIHTNEATPDGFVKDSLTNWSNLARDLLVYPQNDFCQLHANLISNFDEFINNNINNLRKNLKDNGWSRINSDYFKRKVVDLFIKQQAWHGHFARNCEEIDELRNWLLQNAYQPIDSKTLRYLRGLGIGDMNEKKIRKNASMNYVNNNEEYIYFQNEILNICNLNNVPRFAFDFYVWNYLAENE